MGSELYSASLLHLHKVRMMKVGHTNPNMHFALSSPSQLWFFRIWSLPWAGSGLHLDACPRANREYYNGRPGKRKCTGLSCGCHYISQLWTLRNICWETKIMVIFRNWYHTWMPWTGMTTTIYNDAVIAMYMCMLYSMQFIDLIYWTELLAHNAVLNWLLLIYVQNHAKTIILLVTYSSSKCITLNCFFVPPAPVDLTKSASGFFFVIQSRMKRSTESRHV